MPTRRTLGRDSFIRRRAQLVKNPRDNTYYRDWENAEDTLIEGCMIQPFRLAEKLNYEINTEREFSRTGIRIFAPAGTSIEANDRIIYLGVEYSVFGHLGVWTNFRGEVDHVAFLARIREG